MGDVYFSTGQAARELGVNQTRIRALCASEAIDSVCTDGGQFRIARAEVERLKSEGLPAIPRPLPNSDHPARSVSPARSNRGEVALLAEPSDSVIDSAEEVVRLENEVKAIDLRRQKEIGLDWFRDRETREAEQQAEREAAEWRQQSHDALERQRKHWEASWFEYALRWLPCGVPEPYKLDVHRNAQEVLARLKPTSPASITQSLIDAAVARALAPWHNQKRIAETIDRACGSYTIFDSGCKVRMRAAAASAIAELRDGATADEMLIAAQSAMAPLVREFEDMRVRADIVDKVWMELRDGTADQCEEGKDAVRAALADLPVEASRRELERARTTALAPVRAVIAAQKDREARAALLRKSDFRFYSWGAKLRQRAEREISEALSHLPAGTSQSDLERAREEVIARVQRIHERRERKARLIDSGVRQIRTCVDRLAVEWNFDESPYTVARDLEGSIRKVLEEDLRGDEDEGQVADLVRRNVHEELGID